ncbi:MAG TPA: PepSY domain-containing protein, partial [Allosphingosinicella sp.]
SRSLSLRTLILAAAMACTAVTAMPADARPDREQDEALRGTRQGRFIPLRTIENSIVPRMRGFGYLGPELDPGSGRYRLKFIRGGQVVWIDVDARTGDIVGKSGF